MTEDLLERKVAALHRVAELKGGRSLPMLQWSRVISADQNISHALFQFAENPRPGIVVAQELLRVIRQNLANRGGLNSVRAEALIEILTESPRLHILFQVAVGRRRHFPAKRLGFSVADLIEKNRSIGSADLKTPESIGKCAGEDTFAMAE